VERYKTPHPSPARHRHPRYRLHHRPGLSGLAQENYTAAFNQASALYARGRIMTMEMLTFHYPYNQKHPGPTTHNELFRISLQRKRATPLDDHEAVTPKSDGEVWYFEETVPNIVYHKLKPSWQNTAKKYTPFYDELAPLPERRSRSLFCAPCPEKPSIMIPRDV
jgi:hypothetical protein